MSSKQQQPKENQGNVESKTILGAGKSAAEQPQQNPQQTAHHIQPKQDVQYQQQQQQPQGVQQQPHIQDAQKTHYQLHQQGIQQQQQQIPVQQANVATTTTTTTITVPRVQTVGVGSISGLKVDEINEPTIELFNRFVAKDTHCLLGRTGVKISRVCLGTMNFGSIDSQFGKRPGQLNEEQAHTILDRYVELGGNCIDTSDFYPWFGPDVGKTETIIGNWLAKQDRSRIFLITKVRMPIDINNIMSQGLSRGHILDSLNNSLKRLQTDYVDMLVLNGWDNSVSFSETARHLDDLVRMGKIVYIGVCDLKGWQLQRFVDKARMLNLHQCVCYIGEYNLLTRGCEQEVIEVCKRERLGFIAYSPLKYGYLTDESVTAGVNSPVSGSRIEAANSSNLAAMAEPWTSLRRNPVNVNVLNYCHLLSRKYKVTVSQIAIQWLLQTGVVTSICVGVEDVNELDEIMTCLTGEFYLSQEDMDELNFQSTVQLHYPYHKQLSEVIGMRVINPIRNKTEYEQLGLQLTSGELELSENTQLQRLNLRDTVHESFSQALPEQDFLQHVQMKSSQTGLIQSHQFPTSMVGQQQGIHYEQGKRI